MSRPWSPAEVEQRIPQVDDELEQALVSLKDLGAAESEAERVYQRAKSIARLNIDERNKERRDALAALYEIEPDVTVIDLAFERDLAVHAYWDAKTAVQVRLGQYEMLRTLNVSAREISKR